MGEQLASHTIDAPNDPTPQTTMTGLPPEVPVKLIDRKSPDFTLFHYAWDLMYLLYAGGVEIEAVAEQFLKKRAKELPDVYQSRIERFYYECHVGTAIDWYQAAIFETPPQVETSIEDDASDAADTPAAPPIVKPILADPNNPTLPVVQNPPQKPTSMTPSEADDFYNDFEQNCDRAGTPLIENFREYFRNMLIYGRACMLIDLPPNVPGQYRNLLEQTNDGAFDPFTINYDPRQMINYQKDANGRLEWVIFANREVEPGSPFDTEVISDNWYYFDRKNFAKYQRIVPDGERTVPDGVKASKVSEGPHCLSKYGVVPVIYNELPKGLWLMNRAYGVIKEHLNTTCALSWALYMACLAMPVVKMDGEFDVTLSEAGFIKLPLGAEYSWSEPEGKSFTTMADRIESLKEEIFRSFYLISQSRSNKATPAAASGLSKQQDMTASKKILNLYGDLMRSMIQATYQYVSWAREDDYEWDVRGLNFPEGPPDETIDTVAGAMAIQVPSLGFEKEMYKKVVMAILPDMNPKKKAQIFGEIEVAPSSQDIQTQQLMQRAQMTQAADVFPKGSI